MSEMDWIIPLMVKGATMDDVWVYPDGATAWRAMERKADGKTQPISSKDWRTVQWIADPKEGDPASERVFTRGRTLIEDEGSK